MFRENNDFFSVYVWFNIASEAILALCILLFSLMKIKDFLLNNTRGILYSDINKDIKSEKEEMERYNKC